MAARGLAQRQGIAPNSGNYRLGIARACDARQGVSGNELERPAGVEHVFLAKVIGFCSGAGEKLHMVCNQHWPGQVVQPDPSGCMQGLDLSEPSGIGKIIQASSCQQCYCVLIYLRIISARVHDTAQDLKPILSGPHAHSPRSIPAVIMHECFSPKKKDGAHRYR